MKHTKTSSRERPREWVYISSGGGFLPDNTKVSVPDKSLPPDPGNYVITGTIQRDAEGSPIRAQAEDNRWQTPPHVAFANLRSDDPRSVEAFIKRYGLIHPLKKELIGDDQDDIYDYPPFRLTELEVKMFQNLLRDAWAAVEGKEDDRASALFLLQESLQGIRVDAVIDKRAGFLQMETLWAVICFMFFRDHALEKLGKCENPDCPAPYFVKKRHTQKFCEAGACTDHAHRQYALKWWNDEGKKRREQRGKRDAKKGRKRESGK